MPYPTEKILKLQYYEIRHPEIGIIRVFPTPGETAAAATELIIQTVNDKPEAAITWATGNTMIPVLDHIAGAVRDGRVSFAQTVNFHLDERYRCSPDYPESFVRYLQENVVGPLAIPPSQFFFINGLAKNPYEEAERYNHLLRLYGPMDLTIIGFGPPPNPHIGFNESRTPFEAETHYTRLARETLDRDFARGERVITGAITQGPANIFASHKILGVAYGEKGIGLNRALYGEITPECPASGLRLPGVGEKVAIFIDEEAASYLQSKN